MCRPETGHLKPMFDESFIPPDNVYEKNYFRSKLSGPNQKNPIKRADGQQAPAYPNAQKGEMDHEEKCCQKPEHD